MVGKGHFQSPLMVCFIATAFISAAIPGFAACPGMPSSDPVVRTSDVPDSWSSFVMPVGHPRHSNLELLSVGSFVNFGYPKLRFNDNGDSRGDPGEWYVATAHNKNRWLNNGWNAEPSLGTSSLYHDHGHYHPGEDWNLTSGRDADLGELVFPMARGVVLFNGWAYGNTVMVLHKKRKDQVEPSINVVTDFEYVVSVYAHLREQLRDLRKGLEVNPIIDVIGHVGSSGTEAPHLHFEIRKESMLQINASTREVCLRHSPAMWPAVNQQQNGDGGRTFIENNYYEPSQLLFDHVARLDMQVMLQRGSRFRSPIAGTFGKKWREWHQEADWSSRWMAWEFSAGRKVIVLHMTYRLDSSRRFLGFFDPDRGRQWSGWIQVLPY